MLQPLITEIKFAFEVYDFKGEGKVDAFYIGDLIRACNLNPTMNTIENMCGGLKEKGKRMIVLDEMYPIFKKAKDSKDTGGIHDFVEILKLYDKNEDKTILSKDLFRLLTNLGRFIIETICTLFAPLSPFCTIFRWEALQGRGQGLDERTLRPWGWWGLHSFHA